MIVWSKSIWVSRRIPGAVYRELLQYFFFEELFEEKIEKLLRKILEELNHKFLVVGRISGGTPKRIHGEALEVPEELRYNFWKNT